MNNSQQWTPFFSPVGVHMCSLIEKFHSITHSSIYCSQLRRWSVKIFRSRITQRFAFKIELSRSRENERNNATTQNRQNAHYCRDSFCHLLLARSRYERFEVYSSMLCNFGSSIDFRALKLHSYLLGETSGLVWMLMSRVLSYSNSCVNPIIYNFMSGKNQCI